MKNVLKLMAVASLVFVAGCKWFSCCDHSTPKSTPPAASTPSSSHSDPVLTIASMADFETKVIKSDKPVVVDFSATWCGPCKEMKPVFHNLARKHSDKYLFAEIDVDQAEAVAKRYGVQGVPTFMLVKDGTVLNKNEGGMSEATLEKFIVEGFKTK